MITLQPQVYVHIRWLIRRDLPEVCAIERGSFEHVWTEEDFLRCLRARKCIGMVAEDAGDRVVGYMLYELHETKLHVLNFAVAPEWRRRGVGRQMAERLVGKLSGHRRTRLTLVTRESNTAAHLFFRACGFRAVNVLRGYYADAAEDGYLMAYRLRGDAP